MAGRVRDDTRTTSDWIWSRRDFISLTAWASVLGSGALGTFGFVRFLFPRVLFEPSTRFKAGRPEEYEPNSVSEKYVARRRVWIAKQVDPNGTEWMIALLATCTHLGCTPHWLAVENRFKCPCHGSGFRGFDVDRGRDVLAVNFEGPAPRALERLEIWIDAAGEINVDSATRFVAEKGEWTEPRARAKV